MQYLYLGRMHMAGVGTWPIWYQNNGVNAFGQAEIFFDRQFLSLASADAESSLSKTTMINRVREFLPHLRPSAFTQQAAGIRSSVIDKTGKFVPDTLVPRA